MKAFWKFQLQFQQNPLAPASKERKSTVDVISGVLKTRKAESCSLCVCIFLIRNLLETTSWKLSICFKTPLRNLVRSSFLIALQTVYCKPATPITRRLLKNSRGVTFLNIPCTFFDRVAKHRSFYYFTKKWFHHRHCQNDFCNTIFIILGTNKQTKHLRWSQFSV